MFAVSFGLVRMNLKAVCSNKGKILVLITTTVYLAY